MADSHEKSDDDLVVVVLDALKTIEINQSTGRKRTLLIAHLRSEITIMRTVLAVVTTSPLLPLSVPPIKSIYS